MNKGSPVPFHQPIKQRTEKARKTYPDEEDGGAEVACVGVDHVGGDDSNDGVPQPVGGRGKTNTTCTNGEREDLTCVRTWSMSRIPMNTGKEKGNNRQYK